jgi:coenzyme F420-0:L-glutamate ligase/coenzyme F420-1:gamma-L-glutamate ligase
VPVSDADGPGAAVLLRSAHEDWFRHGHVEAVTASLGLDPAKVEPPSVPPGSVPQRFARALALALRSQAPWAAARASPAEFSVTLDGTTAGVASATITQPVADPATLGALAQRLAAAAWAEDLRLQVTLADENLKLTATSIDNPRLNPRS